jgi:hypothetical protein
MLNIYKEYQNIIWYFSFVHDLKNRMTQIREWVDWPWGNIKVILPGEWRIVPSFVLFIALKIIKFYIYVRGEFKFKWDYVNKTRMFIVGEKFISYDFFT